jgi:hypothetical protein
MGSEMSEQVSNSPTVALPSVEVNLTQLNAFNQYIVSRTAVMLTTGGLAAAAGGIIERLHPGVDRIAPGITPWLLYMAAALIPMSILVSFFNLLMDYRLQSLLTDRFGEDIRPGDQIKVTKEDYENFKRSRSNKLKSLDVSFVLLLLGTTALVFHAYELYVSDNDLISRTFEAYQAMNWILIAITLIISVYAVRRLMRRLKRLSVQL